jgi:hypothetical protein
MTVDIAQLKKLRERVGDILLAEWDPIGIRDVPNIKDEYNSYVSAIINMILSNQSEADLSEYLLKIETNEMGLKGEKLRAQRVAGTLRELKNPL